MAKRLRSERDQARADSLRFKEERNALHKEVAELREGPSIGGGGPRRYSLPALVPGPSEVTFREWA